MPRSPVVLVIDDAPEVIDALVTYLHEEGSVPSFRYARSSFSRE